MRYLLILSLVGLASCGAPRSSALKYGETTRADLIAQKGEPLSEEKIPVEAGKILVYPEDEKYQLKGEIVVNAFKQPRGDERLLIFWKHKFKDCQTVLKKLPHDIRLHTPPEYELACPAEGLSVIYSEGSDVVTRVVEYEKQ